ncbi:hypothetical protein AB1Z99_003565 [Vibrio cholerae]
MHVETFNLITVVIAILGLAISIFNLYESRYSSPDIERTIGPYIKLSYTNHKEEKCATNFYVPVSFFNKSNRPAVIEKIAIEVYQKNNNQKRFFMQWHDYSEYNSDSRKWVTKEMAYSLPILGKSSVQKLVHFKWNSDNNENLIFEEGSYLFRFICWESGLSKPIIVEHDFSFDKKTFEKIESYLKDKKNTAINLNLDKEMEANRLLNKHESSQLIG